MEWLWIPAVALLAVFILALCWLFFKDYTCFPCRRRRPPPSLDDVESSRSRSFDGLPPTHSRAPRYYRPSVAPPQPPPPPPLQLPPLISHSSHISHYNFRGIVSASEAVKIKNGVPELDLHELTVRQAKQVTQMFLQQSQGRYRRVRIITGRGLHSLGGIPKIKPEVEKLLTGYTIKEMHKGGCLEVNL